MTVAHATPATPQSNPSTNTRSNPMFSPFINSWIISTPPVRSCAISQPVIPYSAMVAGADQMRIAM